MASPEAGGGLSSPPASSLISGDYISNRQPTKQLQQHPNPCPAPPKLPSSAAGSTAPSYLIIESHHNSIPLQTAPSTTANPTHHSSLRLIPPLTMTNPSTTAAPLAMDGASCSLPSSFTSIPKITNHHKPSLIQPNLHPNPSQTIPIKPYLGTQTVTSNNPNPQAPIKATPKPKHITSRSRNSSTKTQQAVIFPNPNPRAVITSTTASIDDPQPGATPHLITGTLQLSQPFQTHQNREPPTATLLAVATGTLKLPSAT